MFSNHSWCYTELSCSTTGTNLRIGINLDCRSVSSLTHSEFDLNRENISYSIFPFLVNSSLPSLYFWLVDMQTRSSKLYEMRYPPASNVPLPNVFPIQHFENQAEWPINHCSEVALAVPYFKISAPVGKLVKLYQKLWPCITA